jgi:alkaline phosphatase
VSNAHAHNDYEHPVPFYTAYEAGFGSIEADIFLRGEQLYVAHDSADIKPERTLAGLYLDPLQTQIEKNNGLVYPNRSKKLILLIDLKTAAEPTLDKLLKLFEQYKTLTKATSLNIVITGNQPDPSRLSSYPSFIYFDGRLSQTYPEDALKKIALFSDNFRKYSLWNGEGKLSDQDRVKLVPAISKAHALGKPIRFWATPDLPNAWQTMIDLKVDFINTDKIKEVAEFLK